MLLFHKTPNIQTQFTQAARMRQASNPGSWLSEVTRRQCSSHFPRHARFSATRAYSTKGVADDLGYGEWAEINFQEKTVKTAAGDLPISPLLDENWREARKRGKPKARPKPTEFARIQKKLHRDPYAQMLAEPVRMCQLTRARLPRTFLQSFGLAKTSGTNDNWWIPGQFAVGKKDRPRLQHKSFAKPDDNTEEDKATRLRQIEAKLGAMVSGHVKDRLFLRENMPQGVEKLCGEVEHPSEGIAPGSIEALLQKPSRKDRFWTPVHVLSRQDLLASFHDRSSKYSGGHMRFAGHPSIGSLAHTAVWRKDMHFAILEKMRFEILSRLAFLAIKDETDTLCLYSRPIPPGQEILPPKQSKQPNHDCWGLLYVGNGAAVGNDDGIQHLPTQPSRDTPTLAPPHTLKYHLPRLLGAEFMEILAEKAPSFFKPEGQWLLIRTNYARLLAAWLWRLEGYLADYENKGKQDAANDLQD